MMVFRHLQKENESNWFEGNKGYSGNNVPVSELEGHEDEIHKYNIIDGERERKRKMIR